ncbi:pik3r4 kinase-related protein [Cystoisospora suis]|uniref:Pik3r4 kinase-related protein n=1 Tax=Cystoisospora suis TaxID=483139 RepID=A0A2C6LFK3_9APIC|nr:pik3r4 kinase-related protein [Cystoisospora suis]
MDSAHLDPSGQHTASKPACSSVFVAQGPLLASQTDVSVLAEAPSYSTSFSTTMLPSSSPSFSPCGSYESSASFSLSSSNSMHVDSPTTARKSLTHASSWGLTATGASSFSPSGPSSIGVSSNVVSAATLATAHSNAAAAAAQAAQSVAALAGAKPVTATNWGKTGYSSQDQRSRLGKSTSTGSPGGQGLYSTQQQSGNSQRAAPPSLSSLLLSSPTFSSSNSFPATFSTLPASPCSQPPLRRPNTQGLTTGTHCGQGVEKIGPAHLSHAHMKSPTAAASPGSGHPILAGALAGQAAAVAASAAAAAGAAAAKAARTLTEASAPPKNAMGGQRTYAESKLTPPMYSKALGGAGIGDGTTKAGPVVLASVPHAESGRRRDLATSWLRVVCDSAAAQEGKVRRCCSNAPIQPSVLQRQPEKLEGRVVYSNSKSQLRSAGDARQHAASSQLFLQSTTAAWDTSPSYTRESLQLEKLLQSAIYGAVYRASMHTSRIKPIVEKRTESEGLEKEAEGFQVETVSEMVAVKVLSLSLQLNASASLQEDFLSELKFYPYLKGHDNILHLHRVYVDVEQELLFLIFPFAEYEDLFEVLKKRKQPFAEAEVRWLCKQLFEAVLELHRRGIGMRDLSLENVLIFRCPKSGLIIPKLTDPGQAVVACPDSAARAQQEAVPEATFCSSKTSSGGRCTEGPVRIKPVYLPPDKIFGKSFRPPEVYRQCRYDPYKVDSFCLGWMVYYLLTKHQLFQRALPSDDNWRLLASKEASDLLELLGKKNGAVLSVDSLDFIVQLLEEDPHRRLSVQQALEHPFMTSKTVTPVHADRLFPGDALAQQQHQLRQQHHQQVLLQQQQRLQQQFQQHRLRLQRARPEEQFTPQSKEKSDTFVRASLEKQQILGSCPESLTVKPSVVKQQQQRVTMALHGQAASKESSTAVVGEAHLLGNLPKKSSGRTSPRPVTRGAELNGRARSRQGSLPHARESQETKLKSGQKYYGKPEGEATDCSAVAHPANQAKAATRSPDQGRSTQSGGVSSPKSGESLRRRSRCLSRRETSVSSRHEEDLAALRGPSSRSTDVGSTSGDTWGCSSDTDYSCVRATAGSKGQRGVSPSKRRTLRTEASTTTTASRSSSRSKRVGGTSSRHSSPQKSKGAATDQAVLGSRGSLAITVDHVPTSLLRTGSRTHDGFSGCKRPDVSEQGAANCVSSCHAARVSGTGFPSAPDDTALSQVPEKKGHLQHITKRPSVAAMVERFQRISSGSMALSGSTPSTPSGKVLRSPSSSSVSVSSGSLADSSRRRPLQQSLLASRRGEEQVRSDTALRRVSRGREPGLAGSPRTLRGSNCVNSSRGSLPPTPPAGQRAKRLQA